MTASLPRVESSLARPPLAVGGPPFARPPTSRPWSGGVAGAEDPRVEAEVEADGGKFSGRRQEVEAVIPVGVILAAT